eukprot:g14979.t1
MRARLVLRFCGVPIRMQNLCKLNRDRREEDDGNNISLFCRFCFDSLLLSAAVGTALHCHAGTQECSLCRDGRSLPVADGGGVVGQNASRRHLPSHQAPLQMRGLQLGVCCAGIPRRRNAASLVKGQRVSREDI